MSMGDGEDEHVAFESDLAQLFGLGVETVGNVYAARYEAQATQNVAAATAQQSNREADRKADLIKWVVVAVIVGGVAALLFKGA